jgi:hypothetical protein
MGSYVDVYCTTALSLHVCMRARHEQCAAFANAGAGLLSGRRRQRTGPGFRPCHHEAPHQCDVHHSKQPAFGPAVFTAVLHPQRLIRTREGQAKQRSSRQDRSEQGFVEAVIIAAVTVVHSAKTAKRTTTKRDEKSRKRSERSISSGACRGCKGRIRTGKMDARVWQDKPMVGSRGGSQGHLSLCLCSASRPSKKEGDREKQRKSREKSGSSHTYLRFSCFSATASCMVARRAMAAIWSCARAAAT